jgi:hypothetical protein
MHRIKSLKKSTFRKSSNNKLVYASLKCKKGRRLFQGGSKNAVGKTYKQVKELEGRLKEENLQKDKDKGTENEGKNEEKIKNLQRELNQSNKALKSIKAKYRQRNNKEYTDDDYEELRKENETEHYQPSNGWHYSNTNNQYEQQSYNKSDKDKDKEDLKLLVAQLVFFTGIQIGVFSIRNYINQKKLLEKIAENPKEFESIPDNLKNDKKFILKAINVNEEVWEYINKNLKIDMQFCIDAVEKNYKIWFKLDKKMKSNLLDPNTDTFKHFEKIYKKSEELQEIIDKDKKIMSLIKDNHLNTKKTFK